MRTSQTERAFGVLTAKHNCPGNATDKIVADRSATSTTGKTAVILSVLRRWVVPGSRLVERIEEFGDRRWVYGSD
jgi:hypothetical protein